MMLRTASLNLNANDVQNLSALLRACIDGIDAELAMPHSPDARKRWLADARVSALKFINGVGGAMPTAAANVIRPSGNGQA